MNDNEWQVIGFVLIVVVLILMSGCSRGVSNVDEIMSALSGCEQYSGEKCHLVAIPASAHLEVIEIALEHKKEG